MALCLSSIFILFNDRYFILEFVVCCVIEEFNFYVFLWLVDFMMIILLWFDLCRIIYLIVFTVDLYVRVFIFVNICVLNFVIYLFFWFILAVTLVFISCCWYHSVKFDFKRWFMVCVLLWCFVIYEF